MNQKLGFLCFWGIHNSLPSFWAKLDYSRIRIADSLLKLLFKIGVHLIKVELTQLLTLFKMRSRSHTMSNFVTIGLSGITRTCCWGVNRISLKKQNRNSTFNYKILSFDATKDKRSNIMNTNENCIFYLAK